MDSTRGAFRIASFRGIPIRIHFSLVLILPLMALAFGGVFRQAAEAAGVPPSGVAGAPLLWGLGVAVGLFAAILLHELAHVVYALRTGGEVKSITLMMVGGVSEITEMPKRHRDEVWMALAGPVTSVGLAGLLFAGLLLTMETRSFNLRFALFYLAGLNLFLGLFNLVPAFPMDGGRILRGLLAPRLGVVRATLVASRVGKVFAGLFLLAALLTVNVFLGIIAVVVFTGAGNELRQVVVRAVLEKLRVVQVMTPRFHGLEPGTSVEEALGQLRRERRPALPVTEEGRPVGWVALGQLLEVPEAERALRTVGERLKPAVTVTPEEDVWSAVRRLMEAQPPLLLVVEQGRLVGTVDGRDLNAALALHRSELERGSDPWPRWRQERPV